MQSPWWARVSLDTPQAVDGPPFPWSGSCVSGGVDGRTEDGRNGGVLAGANTANDTVCADIARVNMLHPLGVRAHHPTRGARTTRIIIVPLATRVYTRGAH